MYNAIAILTEEVMKVCPITGLSEKFGGFFIHFAQEADEEQRVAAQGVIDNRRQILEKYERIDELDRIFEMSLQSGFTTSYGWKLGLKNDDVLLLSSLFLLAKTAHDAGLPIPEVIDTDGNSHALTIEELTTLMLQYGGYRSNLSKEYAASKKAILEGN